MKILSKMISVLKCNSLTVNHYLQIGSYCATCKAMKDVRPDDVVLVLEKIKDKTEGKDDKH